MKNIVAAGFLYVIFLHFIFPESVVIIDGIPIDDKIIDKYMKQFIGMVNSSEYLDIRAKYIIETIHNHLKRNFSETLKHIEVSNKEVEGSLQEIKRDIQRDKNLRGKTLEEILAFQGITMEDLQRRQKNNIRYMKHLNSLITEDDCKKEFEQHKYFFDGTQVRVSHILVKTDRTTEEKTAIALKRIKDIGSILADPTSTVTFEELARHYSEGPSAENGGDLGFFPRIGAMDEPLAAKAFSLHVGEISDSITTIYGYHIIKVTDRKKGILETYEKCKNNIRNYLLMKRENELLARLRREANIVFPRINKQLGTTGDYK